MIVRTWIILPLLLLLCACTGHKATDNASGFSSTDTLQTREYLSSFLRNYPLATLQDIYKGSFQDYFGPAHILTDREAVKAYILQELETMSPDRQVSSYYEPCGRQGRYYRVDLALIKEGKMGIDEFVELFMQSASGETPSLTQEWMDEWQMIQASVRKVAPQLKDFSADSVRIATLLQGGEYVVHHTSVFTEHYHPHYRIIRKELFEQKILPQIEP